jgi:hypothetical protein
VRLWSLHPKYLDRQGLLACWRESLLAQKVLQGKTRGYRNHPQLMRFRTSEDPLSAIASYLTILADEAGRRGYSFDKSKIGVNGNAHKIPVTHGQMDYEWKHLMNKLKSRDPNRHQQFHLLDFPDAHPLFKIVEGEVESWERMINDSH